VPLNEYEFPSNKIANVQSQLEKLVEKNYYLHQSARDAYRCAALLTGWSPVGHGQTFCLSPPTAAVQCSIKHSGLSNRAASTALGRSHSKAAIAVAFGSC